ncbi:hypothetical protein [Lentilactobacillus sp. Marseille-Q4993]|uniref:hypothetical protein n=1 Tax=Lentilactobacillus sp. Marseille-Q4993 TaxID=3039492 RepID=UPI0024BCBD7F|nr:hypothetical protein [Lentilactobacillus sp. Marseille-Q4993]
MNSLANFLTNEIDQALGSFFPWLTTGKLEKMRNALLTIPSEDLTNRKTPFHLSASAVAFTANSKIYSSSVSQDYVTASWSC